MEAPRPASKAGQPRVRTVGFAVSGEEYDLPADAGNDGSPLPVMIPPPFQGTQPEARPAAPPGRSQQAPKP